MRSTELSLRRRLHALQATSDALAQKHGEGLPQLYSASETSSFLRERAEGCA
jgi:hypothetical protein